MGLRYRWGWRRCRLLGRFWLRPARLPIIFIAHLISLVLQSTTILRQPALTPNVRFFENIEIFAWLVQQPRRFPLLRISRHKNLLVHSTTCQIDSGDDAALSWPPDGVGCGRISAWICLVSALSHEENGRKRAEPRRLGRYTALLRHQEIRRVTDYRT